MCNNVKDNLFLDWSPMFVFNTHLLKHGGASIDLFIIVHFEIINQVSLTPQEATRCVYHMQEI
jgi:hypothetical protein